MCFAAYLCRALDHLAASVLSLAPVVTYVLDETLSGDLQDLSALIAPRTNSFSSSQSHTFPAFRDKWPVWSRNASASFSITLTWNPVKLLRIQSESSIASKGRDGREGLTHQNIQSFFWLIPCIYIVSVGDFGCAATLMSGTMSCKMLNWSRETFLLTRTGHLQLLRWESQDLLLNKTPQEALINNAPPEKWAYVSKRNHHKRRLIHEPNKSKCDQHWQARKTCRAEITWHCFQQNVTTTHERSLLASPQFLDVHRKRSGVDVLGDVGSVPASSIFLCVICPE